MPQVPSCHILTSEEDPAVMAMEDFVETDILLTLDKVGHRGYAAQVAKVPSGR